MKKTLTIINVFWQRALTYRFTVMAYRVGEVCELLVLILMWTSIYKAGAAVGNLNLKEMISYILVGNFFNAVIRNFLSSAIARDIREGTLSMFLIRPMSYFRYVLTREIGRISLATLLSALTQLIVISFFYRIFVINLEIKYLLLIGIMVLLAFVFELLLSFLIGLIAFWTDEVDGIYSTVERIKKFFSGGYFPINLLPIIFVRVSFMLPFSYAFYVPAQLYLKKIDLRTGLKGLLVQVAWILIIYFIIQVVWKRGLQKFEGVGI